MVGKLCSKELWYTFLVFFPRRKKNCFRKAWEDFCFVPWRNQSFNFRFQFLFSCLQLIKTYIYIHFFREFRKYETRVYPLWSWYFARFDVIARWFNKPCATFCKENRGTFAHRLRQRSGASAVWQSDYSNVKLCYEKQVGEPLRSKKKHGWTFG